MHHLLNESWPRLQGVVSLFFSCVRFFQVIDVPVLVMCHCRRGATSRIVENIWRLSVSAMRGKKLVATTSDPAIDAHDAEAPEATAGHFVGTQALLGLQLLLNRVHGGHEDCCKRPARCAPITTVCVGLQPVLEGQGVVAVPASLDSALLVDTQELRQGRPTEHGHRGPEC